MKSIKILVVYIVALIFLPISLRAQDTLEKAQNLLSMGEETQALALLEEHVEKENPNYLNLLGEVWLKKGNGEKALKYFEQAKDIVESEGSSSYLLIGKTYNNIAVALWSMGKSSQALQYHQVALQYREKLNVPLEVAASLNDIGLVYTNSQPLLAIEYYEKAKRIYEKANLPDKIATSYVNIGLAYKFKNEFDEALTRKSVV